MILFQNMFQIFHAEKVTLWIHKLLRWTECLEFWNLSTEGDLQNKNCSVTQAPTVLCVDLGLSFCGLRRECFIPKTGIGREGGQYKIKIRGLEYGCHYTLHLNFLHIISLKLFHQVHIHSCFLFQQIGFFMPLSEQQLLLSTTKVAHHCENNLESKITNQVNKIFYSSKLKCEQKYLGISYSKEYGKEAWKIMLYTLLGM